MNLCHDKQFLINLTAIAGLSFITALFIMNHHLSAGSEQVQFVNLTNSDIDKILAVKAQMQEAKIQANLSY